MVLIYSFLTGYIRKPCSLNISRISFRSSSFRPGRSPISQSIPSRLYLSAPVRWKGSRFTSFKTGIVCKKRIVSCTLFLSSLKPVSGQSLRHPVRQFSSDVHTPPGILYRCTLRTFEDRQFLRRKETNPYTGIFLLNMLRKPLRPYRYRYGYDGPYKL